MNSDNRDRLLEEREDEQVLEQKVPAATAGDELPSEPRFGEFDEDDVYEDLDRDTDYAAVYADEEAEDEFEELEGYRNDQPGEAAATASIWAVEENPDSGWQPRQEEDREDDDPQSPGVAATTPGHLPQEAGMLDRDVDWEEEEYLEEQESSLRQWPLGMIVVGVIALILLTAGGYGVMQQRSAMEDEIRQLRATLATTASPEEVTASREALQEVKERNLALQGDLDAMVLENQRLQDTVAGLESQLQAQKEAFAAVPLETPEDPAPVTTEPPSAPPAAKAPAAAEVKPEPKPEPSVATAAASGWFVNFGSYSQRATADKWAGRLNPDTGRVVVSTGSKDGREFYRVRVVGLSSRDQAQTVARELEREYDLNKLWVGKQ
jgi:cell division septation protein DedD